MDQEVQTLQTLCLPLTWSVQADDLSVNNIFCEDRTRSATLKNANMPPQGPSFGFRPSFCHERATCHEAWLPPIPAEKRLSVRHAPCIRFGIQFYPGSLDLHRCTCSNLELLSLHFQVSLSPKRARKACPANIELALPSGETVPNRRRRKHSEKGHQSQPHTNTRKQQTKPSDQQQQLEQNNQQRKQVLYNFRCSIKLEQGKV